MWVSTSSVQCVELYMWVSTTLWGCALIHIYVYICVCVCVCECLQAMYSVVCVFCDVFLCCRTEEQLKEEEMLVAELKKIEIRKKERERKQQDLQKLISAAEQNTDR